MNYKYLPVLPKTTLFLPLALALAICTSTIGTKATAKDDSRGHTMTKEQRDKLSPQV